MQHAPLVGACAVRAVRLRLHAGVALGARRGRGRATPRRHVRARAASARRQAALRALRQRERQASAQGNHHLYLKGKPCIMYVCYNYLLF